MQSSRRNRATGYLPAPPHQTYVGPMTVEFPTRSGPMGYVANRLQNFASPSPFPRHTSPRKALICRPEEGGLAPWI